VLPSPVPHPSTRLRGIAVASLRCCIRSWRPSFLPMDIGVHVTDPPVRRPARNQSVCWHRDRPPGSATPSYPPPDNPPSRFPLQTDTLKWEEVFCRFRAIGLDLPGPFPLQTDTLKWEEVFCRFRAIGLDLPGPTATIERRLDRRRWDRDPKAEPAPSGLKGMPSKQRANGWPPADRGCRPVRRRDEDLFWISFDVRVRRHGTCRSFPSRPHRRRSATL